MKEAKCDKCGHTFEVEDDTLEVKCPKCNANILLSLIGLQKITGFTGGFGIG